MKPLLYLSIAMMVSSCQDQLVYVGDVPDADREIVMEAIEDEESTPTMSKFTTFKIQFGNLPEGNRGESDVFPQVACTVTISNTLKACEVGGRARRVYITTRHELRHCEGQIEHSKDPTNLMYKNSPCWPESW